MPEKQRRERGSTLKPEQRTYIDDKFSREGLSVKAAAQKYDIAEGNLRNALDGKNQDYKTLETIIALLDVPDMGEFREEELRLFNILQWNSNVYFTGRENTLHALRQELEKSPLASVTLAITGMGGMGKTSTALEYAYRCLNKDKYPNCPRYKAIQFVRADTVETLKYGYADIANALRLSRADPNNLDEAVQAVIRWMMQPEAAPWLLILDNADDPAVLDAFLPKEPERHFGHVLITSRSHDFTGQAEPIHIEPLEEEEGVQFLYCRTRRKQIAGSKEEQAACALVSAMGGLPLALEQAAAYLTQGHAMPFENYLTLFRDQRARFELMKYKPKYGFNGRLQPQTRAYDEALTVWTTWKIGLAKLAGDHADAVDLLTLSAYLHPVGIPRELVIALLPDYFALAEGEAAKQIALYNSLLNVLTRYSLIQRDLNNYTHNVHILVQTVLRDEQQPEEQKRAYERVIRAIADSFPSDDWGPEGRGQLYYPHAERLCDYAEQTGLESEAVGWMLHHTGVILYSQGRIAEAEPYYQRALAMRQKMLPAEHLAIAESLNDLALLYQSQERFAEAEPLYLKALATRQQAFLEGHSDVAETLNNMAVLYNEQERFDEAAPLYQQALEMRRKVFPEDSPVIANSLHNLAGNCWSRECFAEAEALYQQAIEIGHRALPGGHLITAYSLHNLARLYHDQERFTEAEPLFQKALEIWQKSLPEDHLHIALAFSNLAKLYQSQRHFDEAVPLYQEAISIMLPKTGIEHSSYQKAFRNYLICLVQMGREMEAERLSPGFLAWYHENVP